MGFWDTNPDRITSDYGIPEDDENCPICGDPWNQRVHNPPQCRKIAEQQKADDVAEDSIQSL